MFVAETASDEAARKLVRWIDAQDGAESRNGSVIGRFVTFHDVTHLPATAPASALGDLGALGLTGNTPDQARMWVDLSAMETGLSRDPSTAKTMAQVLPRISGYSKGSTVLLSSNNGTSWQGQWQNGGLERARVDPEGAREALYASADRTGIQQDPGGKSTSDSETTVLEGGQWELIRAMLVLTDDGKSAGDLPEELRPPELPAGAVTNVFNTQVFNAFGADRMWMLENNLYAAWAFNDKEVRYELYAR